MTQSNHPPSAATVATKPLTHIIRYQVQMSTSRDDDDTSSLGNLSLTVTFFFLVSNLNLPSQVKTISSCPFIVGIIKGTGLHLTKTSIQVVFKRDEVSPKPSLLETKHTLLTHPFLIGMCCETPKTEHSVLKVQP